MTFPANADADPDPTTQIPWPARQKRVRIDSVERSRTLPVENATSGDLRSSSNGKTKDADPLRKRMSTWDLIKLSISMAGAQIAWTVELGYVPYQ